MAIKKQQELDPIKMQVERLYTFNRNALLGEHERVLRRNASNPQHAEAIIDRVIDQFEDLPPPSRLAIIAGEVPVPGTENERPFCGECIEGWKTVTRGAVSGVEECECRRVEKAAVKPEQASKQPVETAQLISGLAAKKALPAGGRK